MHKVLWNVKKKAPVYLEHTDCTTSQDIILCLEILIRANLMSAQIILFCLTIAFALITAFKYDA